MKVKMLFEEVLPGCHIDRNDNFITDSGGEYSLVANNGEKIILLRYSAWVFGCQEKQKHEVAECSNDLNYLAKKYNVPEKRIVKIEK